MFARKMMFRATVRDLTRVSVSVDDIYDFFD
jgi:hypothetical protein